MIDFDMYTASSQQYDVTFVFKLCQHCIAYTPHLYFHVSEMLIIGISYLSI